MRALVVFLICQQVLQKADGYFASLATSPVRRRTVQHNHHAVNTISRCRASRIIKTSSRGCCCNGGKPLYMKNTGESTSRTDGDVDGQATQSREADVIPVGSLDRSADEQEDSLQTSSSSSPPPAEAEGAVLTGKDKGPLRIPRGGGLFTPRPKPQDANWWDILRGRKPAPKKHSWLPSFSLNDVEVTPDVISILVVYFVQGALGLSRLAITYFLKDDLQMAPAEVAALTGLFTLPWVLKPLYGFMSDSLPIFGYRRRSYLLLSGLLGSGAWIYLATAATTPTDVVVACIASSLAVAVSDVVADSIVVEKARDSEGVDIAGSLQSLCWGSSAVGGIISAYFSGSLLEKMPVRGVFALTAALPLMVTLISLSIDEVPSKRIGNASDAIKVQVMALWDAVKQKTVWLPALFIFLWQATPTSESAFFYFLSNDIGVGPEFLGRVRLGSSIASLVGVSIFQTYLKDVRISKILMWTTLIAVPLSMTQLLLITHFNRQLGIPDEVFTFGDDVILTVLGQIAFMPTLVLAARLCPPGVEGTLFALLMSIFNGGGIVGSELGALLTKVLGVTEKNFTNLGLLVVLCNLSSLLPLPFLRWIKDVEVEQGGANPSTAATTMLEAAEEQRKKNE